MRLLILVVALAAMAKAGERIVDDMVIIEGM